MIMMITPMMIQVDCTVGSALDMFGGDLKYSSVLEWHNSQI